MRIPEYCKLCGEKIVYSEHNYRFSTKTGKATKVLLDWRCPKLRAYGMDLNGHYWKQKTRRAK